MRPSILRLVVAVLVLATGIALGAGPLQHSARERDRQLDVQKRKVARAESRIDSLTSAGAFADAYAQATAGGLVTGKLAGRTIALIQLPGAEKATVDALRTLLGSAGAQVTAEATLASTLASASSRQLVEALTSQMVTQIPGLGIPAGAVGYQRLGQLLARALGADGGAGPGGSPYDKTAIEIVAGLQAANLVTVARVGPRPSLALVVAGPEAESAADAESNGVPVTIVGAFGAKVPTVLAGSTGAAGANGVLGELRADAGAAKAVTGVDSVETAMGRVSVVLALAARARGTIGQYGGVGDVDGAVPAG